LNPIESLPPIWMTARTSQSARSSAVDAYRFLVVMAKQDSLQLKVEIRFPHPFEVVALWMKTGYS
jgi:hypothetical protein